MEEVLKAVSCDGAETERYGNRLSQIKGHGRERGRRRGSRYGPSRTQRMLKMLSLQIITKKASISCWACRYPDSSKVTSK